MKARISILAALIVLSVPALLAQTYNFGQSETKILGLGRDGTLVGQMDLFYGFIKAPGQDLQVVQYPGSIATAVVDIDPHCILGSFTSFSLDVVGFKQCQGQATILYDFGFTFPTKMRSDGTVVGYYSPDGGSTWVGFLQKGTNAMRTYTVPGATSTRIFATDANGRISGDYYDQQGEHGFVWDGTTLQTIDIEHSKGTVVTGMNAKCLVGAFNLSGGKQEGFVRCGDNRIDQTPFLLGGSTFPRSLLPDGTIGGFFYNDALGANSGFEMRKFAH